MSKQKAINTVLTIDQVINNRNTLPVDEDWHCGEVEDDLDCLCEEPDETKITVTLLNKLADKVLKILMTM